VDVDGKKKRKGFNGSGSIRLKKRLYENKFEITSIFIQEKKKDLK
tara:strand:+ start:227 stop:361 length:135 start_codon:yes stop_codon:yes gene_type:complete